MLSRLEHRGHRSRVSERPMRRSHHCDYWGSGYDWRAAELRLAIGHLDPIRLPLVHRSHRGHRHGRDAAARRHRGR
jgi:hypothetical protein